MRKKERKQRDRQIVIRRQREKVKKGNLCGGKKRYIKTPLEKLKHE